MHLGWNLKRKTQRDPRAKHRPHPYKSAQRQDSDRSKAPQRRMVGSDSPGRGETGGLSLHWGLAAYTVKHSKR